MKSHAQSKKTAYFAALVLPGLGQCFQRRYPVAAVFLLAFLVCLGWFVVATVRTVVGVYYFAAHFNDPAVSAPESNVYEIVVSFGIVMVIYVVSVVDVWCSERRKARNRTIG